MYQVHSSLALHNLGGKKKSIPLKSIKAFEYLFIQVRSIVNQLHSLGIISVYVIFTLKE